MPGYPVDPRDQRVREADLRRLVTNIFRACKMSQQDAELLSDTLVVADLRGCHSHGVLRVPDYVKKLTGEGVDPQGRPNVVSDQLSAIVIDGKNSMGQIGCTLAMQKALDRASTQGVAIASVRGSNHCGAMAYYAMLALESDMIGIAATNALPTMAPWGGREAIVGINPLGVAIPCGSEHPLVFDAAFSGSSHGKIRVYHQKQLPIPDDWAFDCNGVPTTDAFSAMHGLLRPIGGYKGVGLAVVMGVLSSLLSGAAYGTELGNMQDGPTPGKDGHFLMAINVSAFEDVERFKGRMDKIVHEIRHSKLADGGDVVYAPGGLEAATESDYRQHGIPLNEQTINALLETSASLGISAPSLE